MLETLQSTTCWPCLLFLTTTACLGIVTVDDALDVLEEEHAEDLQIVGGGRSDSDSGDRGRNIIWFLHRNLWLLFWVASVVIAAFVGTAATSNPTMGFSQLFALLPCQSR